MLWGSWKKIKKAEPLAKLRTVVVSGSLPLAGNLHLGENPPLSVVLISSSPVAPLSELSSGKDRPPGQPVGLIKASGDKFEFPTNASS